MQTAGGPRGRCSSSTLLPKRFPTSPKRLSNTSQTPPGHLPGVSQTRGAGWVQGVHSRSQPHCAIGVLSWTLAAQPEGSAFPGDQPLVSCLDPPCSSMVPSGSQAGAWPISWCHTGGVWIWSCHLPVPRPHLGTALIPKSPGWRGRSPGLAGHAVVGTRAASTVHR